MYWYILNWFGHPPFSNILFMRKVMGKEIAFVTFFNIPSFMLSNPCALFGFNELIINFISFSVTGAR